jgi:prepilin-type N-terminal cleavage/methylation domain-containing protein
MLLREETTMKRRPGITLIEVLVAIFIMSIGLLALLTLFPLGALRMSQALQDDRTSAAASAGANIYDAFGIRTDPQYDPQGPPGTQAPPSLFVTSPTTGPQFQPFASQNGGGIPIYVDPFGSGPLGGPGSYQTTPTPQTPGITRVFPSTNLTLPGVPNVVFNVNATGNIPEPPNSPTGNGAGIGARYFTLLDDMTYFTNGQPDTTTGGGLIPRGDRYTWAFLLHRSPPSDKNGTVDLQIVVYAGRPTAVPSGEATFAAPADTANSPPQFNAVGLTSVVLQHPAGAPPNIRRGSWILDTSYDDGSPVGTNPQVIRPPTFSVHGDFYRVISVSTMDATHVNLELQDPISKPSGISAVMVMDNVADVFKRGVGYANQWEFRNQNP